jgi:2-polyprenyl-3-methyl-5-hydroxy-6-metoxy-1,4-benzoquinol methylase
LATATLSILIPLYNEEEFIGELLGRVVSAPLPEGLDREIVVVDDGSDDGSAEVVRDFIAASPGIAMQLLRHDKNQGKGAAIRTALGAATGEFSIIQDADLEYDPNEYPKLLGPLVDGRADIVFGSRFVVAGERRVLYFWHSLANRLLTLMCNVVADLNLTDVETCYKAFRTVIAQSIPIESNRFGIDTELTVKFARRRARFYETPISYHGRTYEEGKKIGLSDALEAVWVILRSRFTSRLYRDVGPSVLDALSVARKFNGWMAATIEPWVGSRVLEIGAGMGNITRQLCPGRKMYIATDVDGEYLEQLKARFRHRPAVRVRKLDAACAEDFHGFENQLETVVCLNVLEHIEDDAAALESIRTMLEPGGVLILLVPNGPEIFGTLDESLGHHRRYTREGLAMLLARTGYELEEMLSFNRISRPGWKFAGQALKSTTLSQGGMRVFDRLVWLWSRIDGKLPWEPVSIVAIARRRP